ncbi:MAG: DUF1097 domain-containing protein [Sphingomonadaceae bacterium]|nr:DUF1097 domain-containing protein [Sphingomonadaceae bacterium]
MKNILALAVIALVAAVSSVICARLSIPVWTMFIGWIAFVAGGMNARTAAPTYVCCILGLIEGVIGTALISGGAAALGTDLALLVGVFIIVFAALLAQYLPFASLVICYFIGMTTFFASGLPLVMASGVTLGAGLLAGVLSGLIAVTIAGMISRDPSADAA